MSLVTQLQTLTTRIATEAKSLRTLINGNAADLSSLNTVAKTNLVAAINEVFAGLGSGGATNLDALSDVAITTPATGHILQHNGTQFVNVLGSSVFQPLDADLTSIAAIATTSYGRNLLALANGTALTALNDLATTTVAGIVELATTTETTTGTDTTRAVTPAGVAASIAALVASAPGTLDTLNELATALGNDPNFATTMTTALAGKQPLDADLTAIAALVSAADKLPYSTGAGTWALTTFTAAGRALVDDADATAQRATLAVYSTTEIGDPTTDFVATFNAGLV
jgi:hypothetical protein